jgi:hypothetical protein
MGVLTSHAYSSRIALHKNDIAGRVDAATQNVAPLLRILALMYRMNM